MTPRAETVLAYRTPAAVLAAVLAAHLVGGCARPEAPPAGGSEEVVAVIAESSISLSELEAALAAELAEVDRERHEILQRGLERMLTERLLELEGAAQGLSPGALIAEEVEADLPRPTDAEVDAFYEQNSERISQSKEEVAGRIRALLTQQRRQQATAGYLADLADRYGVETYLEPPRQEVGADGFPARGPADAAVTLVEFSDFECPYCSQVVPTLERIHSSYGDRVRIVFRQFPLDSIHPHARKAAEAALCAHEQERFWAMHDALFEERETLTIERLKQIAAGLGLDAETFDACLDSGRTAEAVETDVREGRRLGIKGTPVLFVNGRPLSGARSFEELAAIIDEELES